MKHVAIIGGGLAGLCSAILLGRRGIAVTLFEKKKYPFHRVCGEYVSNETKAFLQRHDLFPGEINVSSIDHLLLSSLDGTSATLPLDLGGFGVSRFAFDHFLFQKALRAGVDMRQQTEVDSLKFRDEKWHVTSGDTSLVADVVIGTFGKRSKLDVMLQRPFTKTRSPYVGVKYHARYSRHENVIELHNFLGGYCGIGNVEDGITNICYLVHRDTLRRYKSIPELEENVLKKNRLLDDVLTKAEFVFDKPEVINEISFDAKAPVENHMLMCGDAAGMITPLCGNGMAMALHGAKLACEQVEKFCLDQISRYEMEQRYRHAWQKQFARRLWAGRKIQALFGGNATSHFAVTLVRRVPLVADWLVRLTHGEPF